jgi:hypothetical protein
VSSTSTVTTRSNGIDFLEPKPRGMPDTSVAGSSRDIRWKQQISGEEMQRIGSQLSNVEKAISEAYKLFQSAKDLFGSLMKFQTSRDLNNTSITTHSWREVSAAITGQLNRYKEQIETELVPALAPIRQEYLGHTFTKTSETPKALLLIAIPSEKLGSVHSFDTLKEAVGSSCNGVAGLRCGILGDARIVITRGQEDKTQRIELVYRGPHKVDLYVNGKRRGSLWNDDAAKLAKRLAEGKLVKFKKEQRYTEFTVV